MNGNKLKFILFQYLLISFRKGQSLENEGHIAVLSNGAARWTFPTNCTSNCRHVEWIPVQRGEEMFVQFSITGSSRMGYLAIALSADNMMGNDDAYVCSKTSQSSQSIRINSAHLTGYANPINDYPMTHSDGSLYKITDDSMTCVFLRPYNVTKTVSGLNLTWSIADRSYYLLFAEGMVFSDGVIDFHHYRTSTSRAFNLLANDFHRPLLNIEDFVNLSMSVPVNPADNIIAEVNGRGLWQVPNNQCPQGSCKSITWEVLLTTEGPMMLFTILGHYCDWIGMAISFDGEVGDDDFYYCERESRNSSTLRIYSGVLGENGFPVKKTRVPFDQIYIASVESNVIVCKFLRPINVTKTARNKTINWDLSRDHFNLFYAEGSGPGTNKIINFHSQLQKTHGPFYFLSNNGYKPNRLNYGLEEFDSLLVRHRLFSPPRIELHAEGTIERLSSGGALWNFPSNCNDGSCKFLTWEPLTQNNVLTFQFTLSGAGSDFIGFRLTSDSLTDGGECFFCMRNPERRTQVDVLVGLCLSDSFPETFDTLSSKRVVRTELTKNSLTCSFYQHGENVVSSNLATSENTITYIEGNFTNNNQKRGNLCTTYGAITPFPITLVDWDLFRQAQSNKTKFEVLTTTHSTDRDDSGGAASVRFTTFEMWIFFFLTNLVHYIIHIPTS